MENSKYIPASEWEIGFVTYAVPPSIRWTPVIAWQILEYKSEDEDDQEIITMTFPVGIAGTLDDRDKNNIFVRKYGHKEVYDLYGQKFDDINFALETWLLFKNAR